MRPLGQAREVTLHGSPDRGATLTADPDAEIGYLFWTNRSSTSTRRLHDARKLVTPEIEIGSAQA